MMGIVQELFMTLFYVTSISWILFSMIELVLTGFVSNYFNVHWLLLGAMVFGGLSIFLRNNVIVPQKNTERDHPPLSEGGSGGPMDIP